MLKVRQSKQNGAIAALLSFIFLFPGLSAAHAIDYTITYDANAGYVGAVAQAGITSGSAPTSSAQASGTSYIVQGQGALARQGFTFGGWNTAIDGSGTTYSGGNTFTLTSNRTLYAIWTIPVAARLIGNGGTMIFIANSNSVTNGGYCLSAGVRGITSDGTFIYFRPSTNAGYICKVTTAGVVVSVNQVVGLENVGTDQLALVYGNGCLFLRKDQQTTFNSIWCISLSNWSLNSISLPSSLPLGGGWLYGNFIQFPDGRIGSVGTSVAAASWSGGVGTGAGQCPTGMYCKFLRLFNVTGTGVSVSTTFSTDFILADSVNTWPSDDHGIATDGTYLYQVRHARGYKVWALQASGPSFLVFNGDADSANAISPACAASTGITGTYCQITFPVDGISNTNVNKSFGNATYFGRAHGLNRYLVGDYETNSKFWLSDSAAPPPGPGNPDITPPSFTSTDTFTVAENIATTFNAGTITVNESATMVIAAGNDGSQFTIVIVDNTTAYIRFKVSPDYEAPTDSGSNNVYDITINATDSAGNTGVRTVNIRVTNVIESSTTGPPTIAGNIYKGVVATLTVSVNAPGTVRFFLSGKRIQGCLSRPTTGTYPNYTASCAWKPPVIGRQDVTASFTPADNTFTPSTSAVGTYWVLKRTTLR